MPQPTEEDFADLLRAVRTIYANMETNYNAFRHTRELDKADKIIKRLCEKHGVKEEKH